MSKHEVRIAAGDWFSENMERVGIYNANYIGKFYKCYDRAKPWFIAAQTAKLQGFSFETHEEATTFVREELAKCAST